MPEREGVPITASVLRWAIAESGLTKEQVALVLDVSPVVVDAWRRGAERPGKTQLKRLAHLLRRPTAVFFLPEPPQRVTRAPAFRRQPGAAQDRPILPVEAAALREAERVQMVGKWLANQQPSSRVSLPHAEFKKSAVVAGDAIREHLGWETERQFAAKTAAQTATELRRHLEASGIVVLHYSLGEEGCRGFSLADDDAPVLAINTSYTAAARSYSYLHELGHLALRDSAICAGRGVRGIERWCEEFAAAFLLPREALFAYVRESGLATPITGLTELGRVSARFKASLYATAISLAESDLASQSLVKRAAGVAKRTPQKRDGGRRPATPVQRVRTLGRRYTTMLFEAEDRGLLRRRDLLDYLSVSNPQLQAIRGLVSSDD